MSDERLDLNSFRDKIKPTIELYAFSLEALFVEFASAKALRGAHSMRRFRLIHARASALKFDMTCDGIHHMRVVVKGSPCPGTIGGNVDGLLGLIWLEIRKRRHAQGKPY